MEMDQTPFCEAAGSPSASAAAPRSRRRSSKGSAFRFEDIWASSIIELLCRHGTALQDLPAETSYSAACH
jgi:hypothetical protein